MWHPPDVADYNSHHAKSFAMLVETNRNCSPKHLLPTPVLSHKYYCFIFRFLHSGSPCNGTSVHGKEFWGMFQCTFFSSRDTGQTDWLIELKTWPRTTCAIFFYICTLWAGRQVLRSTDTDRVKVDISGTDLCIEIGSVIESRSRGAA